MDHPDISSVVGKLFENPDALKSALRLLSGFQNMQNPLSENAFGEGENKERKEQAEAYREGKNAYTLKENTVSEKAKDREALLAALRPYLSPEKQEKIDMLLKILRLLEMAESLGQSGFRL